jgi:anaerobic ribonucleoside-triphosphate reductase activating protein
MKYAGLDLNDMSAAPGVSLTFYTQGCPHRCPGCHNPETWDFNEGYEFTTEVME